MWYLVVLLVFQFVLQFPSAAFTIVYCFKGAVGVICSSYNFISFLMDYCSQQCQIP